MSKLRIGDIVEIPTAKGLAYAQYTHDDPSYGQLIRVFEKTFQGRPPDFGDLVYAPVQFSVFFPLKAAVRRSIFKIVKNQEIAQKKENSLSFEGGSLIPTQTRSQIGGSTTGRGNGKLGE